MISLLKRIARRMWTIVYRIVRIFVWTAHVLRRALRLLLRVIGTTLWSLVTWPRHLVPRFRYYYDVIRTGGLLWLVMQAVRRFHIAPFTMVDGLYYRLCRVINLTRPDSYSSFAMYGSDGGSMALRNFLIDLESRHREDADLRRTRRLEVAIAGDRIEGGSFFSVSHLFPSVQDVHFYASREQLTTELPFFIPAPTRYGRRLAETLVELDHYSPERVQARFKHGRPINIDLPAPASWKATQPFIHALVRSQTIVVVNLPSPDGTSAGMREWWDEFFSLVQATGRPQAFMVIGAVQPVAHVDANPQGLSVFYASQLGMDMLDCMSLVRQVDGYIGAFDEFGLMTVGTGVPALLLEPNSRPADVQVIAPRYLRSETGQILALDSLTPRQVFDNYRRLVLEPRG
jgi:hypothetical protein